MPKTKGKKYHTVRDGDWVYPAMEGYKLMCCDCGLVHTIDFSVAGGTLRFRPVRDKRATAAARRRYNKS